VVGPVPRSPYQIGSTGRRPILTRCFSHASASLLGQLTAYYVISGQNQLTFTDCSVSPVKKKKPFDFPC